MHPLWTSKRSLAGIGLSLHNHFGVVLCHHLNLGHSLYLGAQGCVPGRATLRSSCAPFACFLLKYVWKRVPVTEEHLSVVEYWRKRFHFYVSINIKSYSLRCQFSLISLCEESQAHLCCERNASRSLKEEPSKETCLAI